MKFHSFLLSLMLLGAIVFIKPSRSAAHPHVHKHHFQGLAGRDVITTTTITPLPTLTGDNILLLTGSATPCSGINCVAASQPPACDAANGTAYTDVPEMDKYTIICDIDFPAQNIYPFVLAGSFEECLSQCESFNKQHVNNQCAGFVFAPERVGDADDCYLKSSLEEPASATIHLIGATLAPSSRSSGAELGAGQVMSPTISTPSTQSPSPAQLHIPTVRDCQLLGASKNDPSNQYVKHPMASPQSMANGVLSPGIKADLITNYDIAADTGTWTSETTESVGALADLSVVPHLSRDGGKGGVVDGYHLFIFCDTASFTTEQGMVGFASSSVATDDGTNAVEGRALSLIDHIGEWQDDVGRMRGFSPMTTGEEAFNIALSGDGYRYAVWPESSLISLNKTHALLYASLVYDEVDMTTQAATFTTLGNTLLVVSVDSTFGPGAQRIVKRLFTSDEVAWGSLGGFRSWGSSGVGDMGGMIYLFGQVDGGALVARTTPTGVADRTSYSYWDGSSWSSGMLPTDSTAYLVDQAVMDLDVIYSPYHNTFIMVYLTPNADNTFYYRYLEPKDGILPAYEGGDEDYADAIVKENWSDEQTLYKADEPPVGYIYAGGVHAGYFGDDDITNGGTKMLLSWTQHTGQDAATPESGYSHMTVVVDFN